jgi:hypothetical protein
MTNKDTQLIEQFQIGDRFNARKTNSSDESCYQAEFIGCIPGQCLLFRLQDLNGKTAKIPKDETLELRTVMNGEIIAFQSRVTYLANKPFQLIYLDMPEKIFSGNHRVWPRVPVVEYINIETDNGKLNGPGHFRKGRIANISLSGARVDASEKLGNPGDRIKIQAQLSDDQLMGKTIDANAIIRQTGNIHKQTFQKRPPWVSHGIEFDLLTMKEEQKILLQAYVYEQAKNQKYPARKH